MQKYLTDQFSRLIEQHLNANKYKLEGSPIWEKPQQAVISKYIKLIILIARRYVREHIDIDDLVVEGVLGLLEALRRFNPEISQDFHTFAITLIKGHMYRYYLQNNNLLTVPLYINKTISYLEKLEREITNLKLQEAEKHLLVSFYPDAEYEAPFRELAIDEVYAPKPLNYTLEQWYDYKAVCQKIPPHTFRVISGFKDKIKSIAYHAKTEYTRLVTIASTVHKTQPISQEALQRGEEGVDIDHQTFMQEFVRKVCDFIDAPRDPEHCLPPSEQEMKKRNMKKTVFLMLWEGHSYVEIGNHLGVTRQYVEQVVKKILTEFKETRYFEEVAKMLDRKVAPELG